MENNSIFRITETRKEFWIQLVASAFRQMIKVLFRHLKSWHHWEFPYTNISKEIFSAISAKYWQISIKILLWKIAEKKRRDVQSRHQNLSHLADWSNKSLFYNKRLICWSGVNRSLASDIISGSTPYIHTHARTHARTHTHKYIHTYIGWFPTYSTLLHNDCPVSCDLSSAKRFTSYKENVVSDFFSCLCPFFFRFRDVSCVH